MQSHGVEAVDCFAVDNALIKLADPLFIGHCYSQQTDCGKLFITQHLFQFPAQAVCSLRLRWVGVIAFVMLTH